MSYSGKGVQEIKATKDKLVITVKNNGYKVEENPTPISIESLDFSPTTDSIGAVAREIVEAADGISLTEAENVVSAGRGLKGPENWGDDRRTCHPTGRSNRMLQASI